MNQRRRLGIAAVAFWSASLSAVGQSQTRPIVYSVAPLWQPAPGGATINPNALAAMSVTNQASPTPYYSDAHTVTYVPVFATPTPSPATQPMPAPVMTSPAIVTVPTPAVPPANLTPPAVATTPPPATNPPASTIATPVSNPALAGNPPKPPDGPFTDERRFLQSGQNWREYDITPYTSKFYPSDHPEEAVRKWILRETGPEVWHGSSVSALSVSSQRVSVYHNPQVQQRVADVLGRLVWYTPGEFKARVTFMSAKNPSWRENVLPRAREIAVRTPGRQAWFIEHPDADRLLAHIGNNFNGTLLATKDFRVANGREARVEWLNPTSAGRGPSVQNSALRSSDDQVTLDGDGILLLVDPLIDADAATIDVDVKLAQQSRGDSKRVPLDEPGRPKINVSDVNSNQFDAQFQLPPGKLVLFSLGTAPRFNSPKGLFGRERRDETLVLLELAPDTNNTVAGQPVPTTASLSRAPVLRQAAKPKPPAPILNPLPPFQF